MANAGAQRRGYESRARRHRESNKQLQSLTPYVRSITEQHLDRIDDGTNESATFSNASQNWKLNSC